MSQNSDILLLHTTTLGAYIETMRMMNCTECNCDLVLLMTVFVVMAVWSYWVRWKTDNVKSTGIIKGSGNNYLLQVTV